MQFVQGGAHFTGKQTKARLKELIKTEPDKVSLYGTSDMGPQFHGLATELPPEMTFNVVGPDPYRRRDWYASIRLGRGGNLVVT